MSHHLLTIAQTAELIQMSPVTVSHWAYGQRPRPDDFPAPIKVNRNLRYVAQDLDDWIERRRIRIGRNPMTSSLAVPSAHRRGRPRKLAPAPDCSVTDSALAEEKDHSF